MVRSTAAAEVELPPGRKGFRERGLREREERVERKRVVMGLGTPNRRRIMRKRERERMRPMVKKLEKTKSLKKARLRPFLGIFDLVVLLLLLGFEVEGRIEDDGDDDVVAHDVPRRDEKAMFGLGEKKRFLVLWGSIY